MTKLNLALSAINLTLIVAIIGIWTHLLWPTIPTLEDSRGSGTELTVRSITGGYTHPTTAMAVDPCSLTSVICEGEENYYVIKQATITAFNTVSQQTDSSPCQAAGGNICGRTDAIACPRAIPLGTTVGVNGKQYTCLDRLAQKYDHRFDISFDQDLKAAINFGKQTHDVIVYAEKE